jgi:hypothetical protein
MSHWLHDIVSLDSGPRWKVYRVVMGIGFTYGVFNDQFLKRSVSDVVPEMMVVMSVATVLGLTSTVIRNRKRKPPGPNRPGPNGELMVKLRGYSITLVVVVAVTAILNAGIIANWERKSVDRRISNMISTNEIDFDKLNVFLRSAQDFRLSSDIDVRHNAASRLLKIEKHSAVTEQSWRALTALAGYNSTFSSGEAVIKQVESEASAFGIKPFGLMVWKETDEGALVLTGLSISQLSTRKLYAGDTSPVPGSLAAIVASLGSPLIEHPDSGAGYFSIGVRPGGKKHHRGIGTYLHSD